MSRPGVPSRPARLNAGTTAVLSEDGCHYLRNGEKTFITNGAWRDVLTVFAKVDGEQFTGFIVEKWFEGISTSPEEDKLGIRGSSTVSVVLKDCQVPVENKTTNALSNFFSTNFLWEWWP